MVVAGDGAIFGNQDDHEDHSGPFNSVGRLCLDMYRAWVAYMVGVVIFDLLNLKNLLGLDESEPMLGLKLLVGPRWREFHCLAARIVACHLFMCRCFTNGVPHDFPVPFVVEYWCFEAFPSPLLTLVRSTLGWNSVSGWPKAGSRGFGAGCVLASRFLNFRWLNGCCWRWGNFWQPGLS